MSNLIQYVNKSVLIDQMASDVVSRLFDLYERGDIKNETELFYRLKVEMERFYQRLHHPVFTLREAYGTPVSADYNQMIEEAMIDIRYLLTDCESLHESVANSFLEAESIRQLFASELQYIQKKAAELKTMLNQTESSDTLTFIETFTHSDHIENLNATDAAFLNKSEGVLSLPTRGFVSYNEYAVAKVKDGSNGFPGNTHVVDVINEKIVYDGDSECHFDLSDILDQNEDTWFEYEHFLISDKEYERCKGYGFNYEEGARWIVEDQVLKLKLEVSLTIPSVCNWISLVPFISERKGVKASWLKRCVVSDGGSRIQEIANPILFDGTSVIMIEPQLVKDIVFEFEQPASYQVSVAHPYYVKVTSDTEEYHNNTTSNQTRVDGPVPSIQNIGMFYDPTTQQYIQPRSDAENLHLKNEELSKDRLFNFIEESSGTKGAIESIPAERRSIGIKKVSVCSYEFGDYGEYVSKAFVVPRPITAITLEADDSVPAVQASYSATQWINYDISIDNGVTWLPIQPKSRSYLGFCTYQVNSSDLEYHFNDKRSDGIGSITTFENIYSVKVRIRLSNPTTEIYQSPLVYQYKLKINMEE